MKNILQEDIASEIVRTVAGISQAAVLANLAAAMFIGRVRNHAAPDWEKLRARALAEVEATLAALPAPLREPAGKLPVTFERLPNRALQADGIDPDTLGLFCGPDFSDEPHAALPPQIILFLENLWDMADGDMEIFLDEVHTTYLHELGHYLGLDEDELAERGLE